MPENHPTTPSAAESLTARAERAASAAGERLADAAESLQDRVRDTAGTGARLARGTGETLAEAGRYLQEAGIGGALEDVTLMIRRHPMPALMAGVALGYLIGRWRTR
jgi:hypothetical protein